MKRLIVLASLLVAALALAAVGTADPSDPHGKKHGASAKTKPSKSKASKGGKFTFTVTTADHGCEYRVWAMDHLKRTYTVKRNQNGTYTIRRADKGTFLTTGPRSPSGDPCPGVIRRGKHGQNLTPGITGKMHGYITGTASGGTFNPNGHCTAECTNADFIAGFFTPGTRYTCLEGYAGCRFSFEYTAQKQNKQKLLYHHWVDRGTNGVNETFIGDIATS